MLYNAREQQKDLTLFIDKAKVFLSCGSSQQIPLLQDAKVSLLHPRNKLVGISSESITPWVSITVTTLIILRRGFLPFEMNRYNDGLPSGLSHCNSFADDPSEEILILPQIHLFIK